MEGDYAVGAGGEEVGEEMAGARGVDGFWE